MPSLPDPQTPEVAPPDPQTIAASQPSPPPDLSNAGTPAVPTQAQPSVWKGILAGALAGLAASKGATSLGGGLASGAGGALAMQEQQKQDALRTQQAQSGIRFQDAQSAHMLAENTAQGQRLAALPDELQDEAYSRATSLAERWKTLGWQPTLAAVNSHGGATAGASQLTSRDGAIGPLAIANTKDHLLAFDIMQGIRTPAGLSIVNHDADITGGTHYTPQEWGGIDPGQRVKILGAAANRTQQIPADGKAAQAQLQEWTNYLAGYQQRGGNDPAVENELRSHVKFAQRTATAFDNHDVKMANAVAEAKQEAKPVSQKLDTIVFDPDAPGLNGSKGANVMMSQAQASAKGLVGYKGDGNKVNSLVAGVNDVQTKLNQLADASVDMVDVDPGISASLSGDGINLSYHGAGLGSLSDILNAKGREKAMTGMNDATRKYLIALAAAHEAVTQLPRLQTMGQSSRVTEKQMEAAVRLLPVPGDDADMAQSKMDSLQSLVDPIRKQIPQMPGASLTPSFTESPTSRFNQAKRVGAKPPTQSANPEAYLLGPNN